MARATYVPEGVSPASDFAILSLLIPRKHQHRH
jgi:hypothetical protein